MDLSRAYHLIYEKGLTVPTSQIPKDKAGLEAYFKQLDAGKLTNSNASRSAPTPSSSTPASNNTTGGSVAKPSTKPTPNVSSLTSSNTAAKAAMPNMKGMMGNITSAANKVMSGGTQAAKTNLNKAASVNPSAPYKPLTSSSRLNTALSGIKPGAWKNKGGSTPTSPSSTGTTAGSAGSKIGSAMSKPKTSSTTSSSSIGEQAMDTQRYDDMRRAYQSVYMREEEDDKKPVGPHHGSGVYLKARAVLPKPSVTKVNIEVNPEESKVGTVEKAYYAYPAGFDPTNREDITRKGTQNEEYVSENRRAARAAGGFKDDSKKQTDPSKPGFTGISNSIDAIRKQSAAMDKEKKEKNEELQYNEGYDKPDEKLKTDRDGYRIPKKDADDAKARLLAKAKAKRAAKNEELIVTEDDILNYMVESGLVNDYDNAYQLRLHMSEAWFDSIYDGILTEKKSRCWTGYEPTPGKKPYSDGSCKKA